MSLSSHMRIASRGLATITALVICSQPAFAQESRRSLDIGVNATGLSIGDSERWRGVRINFRDTRLESADGINLTLWSPTDGGEGDIRGLAIGVPLTGGAEVIGLSVAAGGISATRSLGGISVAGLGLGAGGDVRGIALGGLGLGAGGSVRGVALAGLGIGAAKEVRGIAVAGLGLGTGGDVRGLIVGGLGAGGGGDVRGAAVGGLGVAAGGSLHGVMVGGLGAGLGKGGRGIVLAGLGAGIGGSFDGIALGGLGVGAGGAFRGVAAAGVGVGGRDLSGLMLAGGSVRVVEGGTLNGVGASLMNYVQGHQRGLTIGLVNYTRTLSGVQVGLVNIVRENPSSRRVLPFLNWGSTAR
jgi:hypothetical protein